MRLLDRGFFRIGSEDYAEENDTYGIATMGKRHVTVSGDEVTFDYEAKGGQRRVQAIGDPEVAKIARALKQRRGGGEELLAYKVGRPLGGREVRRHQRVREGGRRRRVQRQGLPHLERHGARRGGAGGVGHGADARRPPASARRARAVKEVARYLGNTPAVCRASYIDPRVFDRFDGGLTIGGVLPELAEDTAAVAGRPGDGRGGRARPARGQPRVGPSRGGSGAGRGRLGAAAEVGRVGAATAAAPGCRRRCRCRSRGTTC